MSLNTIIMPNSPSPNSGVVRSPPHQPQKKGVQNYIEVRLLGRRLKLPICGRLSFLSH